MTIDIYESIIVLLPQLHRMTALMKYRIGIELKKMKLASKRQSTYLIARLRVFMQIQIFINRIKKNGT